MTEVQYRNRKVEVPQAHLARPLFIIGILAGLLAIVLFQLAVRGQTLVGYDVTEASYVLALVSVPLVFFALVWAFRSFASAIIFGTLGLLVALMGVALFSYYFPAQIDPFGTAPGSQTVMVMNVYLLGILLLLVGLYAGHTIHTRRERALVDVLEATPEKTETTVVTAPPVAMGQVLPVNELEGIRKAEARRLRETGVHHTGQLLYRDPAELSRAARVDAVRVRAWQSMADLVRINGVGPQFAATLYRAGVVSVGQLADETPETLVQRVERAPQSGRKRVRASIDEGRARAWIEEARELTKVQQPAQTKATTTASTPRVNPTAQ